MSIMDFGAIAFKNGKLISTEKFTPMIDMVGWEDTEEDVYHNYEADKDEPLKLKDNYFAYIGDKDCTLAFYKCAIVITERLLNGTFYHDYEYFNCARYTWSKWVDYTGYFANIKNFSKVKVTKRNGYYVCKWKYKGDKYKVYFGLGVSLAYYKKYHIVNYYRSPEYLIHKIPSWIKNKIYDFKYCR